VAGVAVLSGFLVNEAVLGVGPEALGDTPIFWGHGTQDPAVPHGLALDGRSRLKATGADLEARDYVMGHWVTPQEMADLKGWVDRILSPGNDSSRLFNPPPAAAGG
jgi:phospholipase/carboxylesterase